MCIEGMNMNKLYSERNWSQDKYDAANSYLEYFSQTSVSVLNSSNVVST